ncbi:alpha/beta family hydrolase [Dactylosporangium sp. NPDC051484]|uniref:alpha/beta family hydrolase n=1 Tax=Dactylosporangium sp. NPDC051484 TaxID=3154942 RepID=UPI00344BEE83
MVRSADLVPFHALSSARAAVLVLPGGAVCSRGRYWTFVDIALRDLCCDLAEQGAPHGLAVHLLRYRYRGWNRHRADTAVDAEWALARIADTYGDVPVVLVGNSLGGRAAFWVAGHAQVTGVVGVAPWLPEGDPVEHLAGRKVLILHGDRDRGGASARRSLAYAQRARTVVPDLLRFEVVGDGHYLLRHTPDCWAVTVDFVLGTLGFRPFAPPIAAALADGHDRLRTPMPPGLASGK